MSVISVLVSQRRHPVSGRWVRNPGDAVALALALQTAGPEQVRVLCAGPLQDSVARDYLAQGARDIDVLRPAPGEDVVEALQRALGQPASTPGELILTGLRAEGSGGSGLLPYALAQQRGYPVLRDVVALRSDDTPASTSADTHPGWLITQALPRGARRQWQLQGSAVLAIHPSANAVQRHAHAALLKGRIWHVAAPEVPAVPVQQPVASTACTWQTVPAVRRTQPLAPQVQRSGHDRMRAALGENSTAAATQVLQTGSARDKAEALLRYLIDHALLPDNPASTEADSATTPT
jgi:electron transfer flavoprotein beta subunit